MSATAVVTLGVTGDAELDARVKLLGKREATVARRSVAYGLTPAVRAIRKAAPRRKGRRARGADGRWKREAVARGDGAALHKAIGKRQKKIRKSKLYEVKAGVNVGKDGEDRAPHGHLVALGTGPRNTGFQVRTRRYKDGKSRTTRYRSGSKRRPAYRGSMPSNDFVPTAVASVAGEMADRVRKKAWEQVEKAGLGRPAGTDPEAEGDA